MPTLDEVLALHPSLTTFGFGQFQDKTAVRTNPNEFNPARIEFLRKLIALSIVPNRSYKVGSYGGKHVMEHLADFYFANGEFIVAMLMEGYPMRTSGVNASFKANYVRFVSSDGARKVLTWTPHPYPIRTKSGRDAEAKMKSLHEGVVALITERVPGWKVGDPVRV